ncbi:MAG: aldo/keto reductase [Phycisphaerae bacterium]
MEYRQLGRSGVKVSCLCLGCMNFGVRTPDDEAVRIIHEAIDQGINFLDTANIYGQGRSEEIVGKALADGRRDKVFLATKVTSRMGEGPNNWGSNRYHIMQQCHASLRRLRTDHIDLYQLHQMDHSTSLEETLQTLDDLVRQGKVLYIGTSKFAPAYLVEALMICQHYGWAKFLTEQPPYNLLDRSIENELIWTCQRHGLGIIPWAPMATGILSGQYRRGSPPPPLSRAAAGGISEARLTDQAIERTEQIARLAAAKGVTPAEYSLAWVLRRPGITAPIIGVRTREHLTSCLSAIAIQFTADELAEIDRLCPPGSWVSDYWDVNVHRRLRPS